MLPMNQIKVIICTFKMRLESIDCVAHTYLLTRARVHTLLGNRQLRCQSQSSVATENARKKSPSHRIYLTI